MCLRPRYIINPTKALTQAPQNRLVMIPCGMCAECIKRMQEDWFIRAFFDYEDSKARGLKRYFPTLTYTNEALPMLCYDTANKTIITKRGYEIPGTEKGGIKYLAPAFDRKDIDRFINSFRKRFERKGVNGIKFFAVSDLGDKNTKRSHWHVNLDVPASVSESEILSALTELWPHGQIGVSSKGLEVKSFRAVKYNSKYMVKVKAIKKNRDLWKLYQKLDEVNQKIVRKAFPTRIAGKGFGLSMVDYLLEHDALESMKSGFDLNSYLRQHHEAEISAYSKNYKFSIPNYIYKKMIYTKQPHKGYFELSKFGRDLFKTHLNEVINNAAKRYEKTCLLFNKEYKDIQLEKDIFSDQGSNDTLHSYYAAHSLRIDSPNIELFQAFNQSRLTYTDLAKYSYLRLLPQSVFAGLERFDILDSIEDVMYAKYLQADSNYANILKLSQDEVFHKEDTFDLLKDSQEFEFLEALFKECDRLQHIEQAYKTYEYLRKGKSIHEQYTRQRENTPHYHDNFFRARKK